MRRIEKLVVKEWEGVWAFQVEVNRHLELGWRVVPGTLSLHVWPIPGGGKAFERAYCVGCVLLELMIDDDTDQSKTAQQLCPASGADAA